MLCKDLNMASHSPAMFQRSTRPSSWTPLPCQGHSNAVHNGCHCVWQVYDINGDDTFGGASFELVDGVQYWEVPLEGHGELQNPVPAADGSLYQVSLPLRQGQPQCARD